MNIETVFLLVDRIMIINRQWNFVVIILIIKSVWFKYLLSNLFFLRLLWWECHSYLNHLNLSAKLLFSRKLMGRLFKKGNGDIAASMLLALCTKTTIEYLKIWITTIHYRYIKIVKNQLQTNLIWYVIKGYILAIVKLLYFLVWSLNNN